MRQHGDLLDALPKEIVGRYLQEKCLVCFSMIKPSETKKDTGNSDELAKSRFCSVFVIVTN